MVKITMSSEQSEPEESETLAKAKVKLIIQQSLIDSSARTLHRLKESTKLMSPPVMNGITPSSNGEVQSAIDDDINLQENKLMKGFSNQLVEKHRYMKYLVEEEGYDLVLLEKVKGEFDKLINLQQFLHVSSLQPSAAKALLEEEDLTLDSLLNMLTPNLEQLLAKYSIADADRKKLYGALDHLSVYYGMWERGEKPSVTAPNRLNSSASSRLNSISNLSAIDHDSRTDSISSFASAGTSPLPLHPPTYYSSSFTPTPITPLSAQSLLSPSSPFATALSSSTPLNSTFASHQISYVMPNGGVKVHNLPPHNLIRSHSGSSNVLLEELQPPPTKRTFATSHNSVSSLNSYNRSSSSLPSAHGQLIRGGNSDKRQKLPLTHKRSLSNPLANIVLDHQEEEEEEEEGQKDDKTPPHHPAHHPSSRHVAATNGGSSLARYSYRSPSPPSRAGSQPSISSNSVGGSPKSYRHPQMKRIVPSFSHSISNDQFVSGSESVLCYQNARQTSLDGPTPRCNSMAGMSRSNYSHQSAHPSPLNPMDLSSSSMVDLPVGFYSESTERLDQVEECNLPNSVFKSRSVPRLTFLTVSNDNDKGGIPSASTPTSPRTPGTCTPTGLMRHTIMHRFTAKTYITPHLCDFCKKSVMIGVRCKDCKYKCHKSCAAKAPPSCGLPQELMNFFRKQLALTSSMERLADQRVDQPTVFSPSEQSVPRPPIQRSSTYDCDTRDMGFHIQDLASEPTNTHFSPIMKRTTPETINGVVPRRHELYSQSSTASLLEVPQTRRMPGIYRSTSSTPSPSTSPPTSPSLTPSSPRSPSEYATTVGYAPRYRYSPVQSPEKVYVKHGDESDEYYDTESVYSSEYSSSNDVSDQSRMMGGGGREGDNSRGLRPGPQKIILAKSLPDLLRISPTEIELDESCSKFLERPVERKVGGIVPKVSINRRVSVDSHHRYRGGNNVKRKESLSTTDSKASTLVPTEEDDYDSDSYYGSQEKLYQPGQPLTEEEDYYDSDSMKSPDMPEEHVKRGQPLHRNSVVDEWNIPFDSIKMSDCIGRGRMSAVHKGNWHGEVAIKHFYTPGATRSQIMKFKEEVSVLKRTRHENLALFMGASLLPPNLAIVTIFCKGPTLYKLIHVWSEPFHQEKCMDVAKQISQAMGYLHARAIIHKNLSTKNIFIEKGKVVITDTGLSSLSDNFWANQHNHLVVRRNKLYYLAPEIITTLTSYQTQEYFHHSDKTDVYAFGTVLYELMIRKFPFSSDQYGSSIPPEALIHLIGSGRKPEIQSRDIPARTRDLMYDCWHIRPERRLPFKTIHEALIKLSRKKTPITRSPSFPISLSKSTEGLDFLIP